MTDGEHSTEIQEGVGRQICSACSNDNPNTYRCQKCGRDLAGIDEGTYYPEHGEEPPV